MVVCVCVHITYVLCLISGKHKIWFLEVVSNSLGVHLSLVHPVLTTLLLLFSILYLLYPDAPALASMVSLLCISFYGYHVLYADI